MSKWPYVFTVTLALAFSTPAALAQTAGSWLDRPLKSWNEPGMAIPKAPPNEHFPPDEERCGAPRPPEWGEDFAVTSAGWTLDGHFRGGWGIAAVEAKTGTDGMCRPTGRQVFLFSDGAFIGTISPNPMNSRGDGEVLDFGFDRNSAAARFIRYAPSDPLCCPSRQKTHLSYSIARGDAGPVLMPIKRQDVPQ